MAPTLRNLLTALLLLAASLAAMPSATASEPVWTPPPNTWTVFTTVTAEVADNYAIVQVQADIRNRGPDPEFPFEVIVPEAAMVTGLTITRDGETFEAQVAPREDARAAYEEHKAAEMTGGLVEKERGSSTYRFLVNVAEFESVVAVLTYEMPVAADRGIHDLPLSAPVSGFGMDLGAAFNVFITSSLGTPDAWMEPTGVRNLESEGVRLTHSVGSRPDDAPTEVVVRYVMPPTPEEGALLATFRDGKGYFVHRFEADADGERLPVDLALVLDVSGSMQGDKIEQLHIAAAEAVRQLGPEDRLHITLFSTTARSPWEGMRAVNEATKQEALAVIADSLAAGGTGIESGLTTGLEAFTGSSEGVPVLLFMTDGQPTSGERDPAKLREIVQEANDEEARIFAIAFGEDADWGLVAGFARDGGGMAIRVLSGAGAEIDLERFMTLVSAPVLEDLRIDYENGVHALDAQTDVLFAGSELLVVGTFDADEGRISGTVKATSADGPYSEEFSIPVVKVSSASHIERMVVFRQIRDLQERILADGEKEAWVDEIVRLAVEHSFVTDYTSLVLTLESRSPNQEFVDDWGRGDRSEASAPAPPTAPTSPVTPPSPPASPAWNSPGGAGGVAHDSLYASETSPGSPPADQDLEGATVDEGNQDEGSQDEDTPMPGVLAIAALLGALLFVRRRK